MKKELFEILNYPDLKEPCKTMLSYNLCLGCSELEDKYFVGNWKCEFYEKEKNLYSLCKALETERFTREKETKKEKKGMRKEKVNEFIRIYKENK